jgi:hypothetical protein
MKWSWFYGYRDGDDIPEDLKRIDDRIAAQHVPGVIQSGLGAFYGDP